VLVGAAAQHAAGGPLLGAAALHVEQAQQWIQLQEPWLAAILPGLLAVYRSIPLSRPQLPLWPSPAALQFVNLVQEALTQPANFVQCSPNLLGTPARHGRATPAAARRSTC
jgi:hypothetical protein